MLVLQFKLSSIIIPRNFVNLTSSICLLSKFYVHKLDSNACLK